LTLTYFVPYNGHTRIQSDAAPACAKSQGTETAQIILQEWIVAHADLATTYHVQEAKLLTFRTNTSRDSVLCACTAVVG